MNLIYAYSRSDNHKIVYVGQTIALETRHKQHMLYDPYNENCKEYNYPLSRGIRKYGADFYKLIILEENVPLEKLDEREKYWIAYYDTYWHGYNQTIGGTWPTKPIYSEDVINLVIDMLQDENFSYNDIKEKTGISLTHIYNINTGQRRAKQGLNYPIRKSNAKGSKGLKFDNQTVYEIHKVLLKTNKTFKEIAQMFNCSKETISRINAGKTKNYVLSDYSYPLRKHPHAIAKQNYWNNKKACIDYPDKGSKVLISTESETAAI